MALAAGNNTDVPEFGCLQFKLYANTYRDCLTYIDTHITIKQNIPDKPSDKGAGRAL